MKIDSFHVYRGFQGEYAGRVKIYVGDLIVEVSLLSREAEDMFKHSEADLTDAYERAKAVVRGARDAA